MSIFEESKDYKPFKYPWAVDEAKKHSIDMFWDVHTVELTADVVQYQSKNGLETSSVSHEDHKKLLDALLGLFTETDKVVGEGYTKLLPYVKNNEIRNLLLTFAQREVVHQRAYALASEAFGIPDSSWSIFRNYTEMTDKLDVINGEIGDLDQPLNFAKQLVKILLSEGISLFCAFSALLNLKRYGKLIGFNDVNRYSLFDEQVHIAGNIKIVKSIMQEDFNEGERAELVRYATVLSSQLCEAEKLSTEVIYSICDLEGVTKEEFLKYPEYLRELRLSELGFAPLIVENPLEWMDYMTSNGAHENFFEKRVTAYSHKPLEGKDSVDFSKFTAMLEDKLLV